MVPHAIAFGLTLLLLAGGCTSVPVNSSREVLVTFPVPRFEGVNYGGSRRVDHGGAWSIPLHTRADVSRFADEHALIEVDAWPIHALGVYCVVFTPREPQDLEVLVATLNRDRRAALVEENHSFEGMIARRPQYDDPLLDLQYGEFREELEALHAISTGQHVKLGLIDSSIDLEHPDLVGQIAEQTDLVPVVAAAGRIHGTAVAGVIGATPANGEGVVGLAPAAKLYAYAACRNIEDKTLCSSFAIAKALTYAIEDQLDILNISLAGPRDRLLEALIDEATSAGMIIIAADNAADPERSFPASASNVIAAHADDPLWFARSEQLSTRAGGGYQVFYGSSIAAAGLAGFAAVIRAQSSAEATRRLLVWLAASPCEVSNVAPVPAAFDAAHLCN